MLTYVVQRTLTSAQAREQRVSHTPELSTLTMTTPVVNPSADEPSADPPGPPGGDPPNPGDPGAGPSRPPGGPGDPNDPNDPNGNGDADPEEGNDPNQVNLSNQDLARAIMSLASASCTPKRARLKPNPLTHFSGGTNEQL